MTSEERSAIETLKERLLWCSLWRMNWKDLPGPRDWSPRVKRGKESLAAYWSCVPQHMLMSIEQVKKSRSDRLIDLVESGMGFVVNIRNSLEVVYISLKGHIEMSQSMRDAFDALFGLGGE